MINLNEVKFASEMNDLCTHNGGCNSIPSAHELNVKVGYDRSLMERESDPKKWISASLTHTQAHLLHPSLPTKIKLNVIGEPKAYPNERWTAETSIKSVRKYAKGDQEADLYIFFAADAKSSGTVGIAYVGALCEKNGFQVSVY